MKLEKFFNYLGFGLLALCIVLSLYRVITRQVKERDPEIITIRFAHWQLEGGVRDAFERVIKSYEAKNPLVRVEQILVPERVYPTWSTTQLIGGTGPDLIELGKGSDTGERVARFFLPSTEIADRPNPYNRGTPLESVAWRNTFVDGMEGAYRDDLADYYGIPTFLSSVRLYYNKQMLREIQGSDTVPSTYDELIKLCELVQEFSARPENRHRKLTPMAGSKYNSPMFMDRIFQSQLQMFPPIRSALPIMNNDAEEMALNYLRGRWSLHSPQVTQGLELSRDVGQYMQQGFMQGGREDATLYFIQQRALLVTTGSWDASSMYTLAKEAGFEVGAFQTPLPDKNHPKYGQNVLGIPSEANIRSFGPFALYRGSKHQAQALDFLQYLTSMEGNALWSSISNWPPIIIGVEANSLTKPFMPVPAGEIDGLNLHSIGNVETQTGRLIDINFNKLVDPNGSEAAFVSAIEPGYGPALELDLREKVKVRLRSIRRQDGNIISATYFQKSNADSVAKQNKHDSLWESQLSQELANGYISHELQSTKAGVK